MLLTQYSIERTLATPPRAHYCPRLSGPPRSVRLH
jgi:hypothetical protein